MSENRNVQKRHLARVLLLQIDSSAQRHCGGICSLCGCVTKSHAHSCPAARLREILRSERSEAAAGTQLQASSVAAGDAAPARPAATSLPTVLGYLEPWAASTDGLVWNRRGDLVIDPLGGDLTAEESRRYMDRIVDCINFCVDIPSAALSRGDQ